MQRLALFDLTAISSDVVLYPGTLHMEEEVHMRLALQEETMAESQAHSIPSMAVTRGFGVGKRHCITWEEVAVDGADVTVNNAHDCNAGAVASLCFR
ncbi:hypothetical protein SAY87_002860 [Trapa incisa]|uniref:Uncharacterized protein n=1 Tax=Trapa incisa TaxID=236973 RepID=A0AAN7QHB6_9MYRT|nr:hypothetical protein SAY87_002860 [Trapa incisa]